eukprot:480062_1
MEGSTVGESLSVFKEVDHLVWGYVRKQLNDELLIYENIKLIIDYFGNMFFDSKILTIKLQSKLILLLSQKIKNISAWNPLFCGTTDGFSLSSLEQKCETSKNTVTIIESNSNDIFIVYSAHKLRLSSGWFRPSPTFTFTIKAMNPETKIGKIEDGGTVCIWPNWHLTDLNSFNGKKFTVMNFEVFGLEL